MKLKVSTLGHKNFKKKELKCKILKILTLRSSLSLKIRANGALFLAKSQEKLGQTQCFISENTSSIYRP